MNNENRGDGFFGFTTETRSVSSGGNLELTTEGTKNTKFKNNKIKTTNLH